MSLSERRTRRRQTPEPEENPWTVVEMYSSMGQKCAGCDVRKDAVNRKNAAALLLVEKTGITPDDRTSGMRSTARVTNEAVAAHDAQPELNEYNEADRMLGELSVRCWGGQVDYSGEVPVTVCGIPEPKVTTPDTAIN